MLEIASRRCAVPVLDFRRNGDHIAGMKDLGLFPFVLEITFAGFHNEHLAGAVVDVPVGVGAVFKGHIIHGNVLVFRKAGKPAFPGEKFGKAVVGTPLP